MIFDLIKNKPAGIVTVYRNIIPRVIDGKIYWFEKFTKVEELTKEFFENSYHYKTIIDCPQSEYYRKPGILSYSDIGYIKNNKYFYKIAKR